MKQRIEPDPNWHVYESVNGIDLSNQDLQRTLGAGLFLPRANLYSTALNRSNLRGIVLVYADLDSADLKGADMRGAVLRYADLTGACLSETDLRDADLTGANLANTITNETDFRGAVLHDVIMNWTSQPLVAERLYQAAETVDQRKTAAFIGRAIGFTWWEVLTPWELKTMSLWQRPEDELPDFLIEPMRKYDKYRIARQYAPA
jgi:hypothetical protein